MKLISIEEARSRVLADASPLEIEARPLADALGMVLGEEIFAPHSVPLFDNSGMDGYAVRAQDTVGAAPDSPQAHHLRSSRQVTSRSGLGPEEAAKIMTGAPVPQEQTL